MKFLVFVLSSLNMFITPALEKNVYSKINAHIISMSASILDLLFLCLRDMYNVFYFNV